ncbi:MAG: hypothetical protein MUP16_07140 [Sedimentisphaerales bacterium]|nr:hypothetical protein [Sedimentisphaerales bacterium]
MKPSPFVWVKVSDYGTSTPIVARTVYQSQRLLDLYPFRDNIKQQIVGTMWEIQRRILECFKISQSVIEEIEGSKKVFNDKVVVDPSFHPWIMNLDTRLESFLQSAKMALRDIGGIFRIFFKKEFGHKYHNALNWAREQFGENDLLTKTLNNHSKWIAEVIDMRNSVEHPADGPRGRLHIENFRIRRSSSRVVLSEPLWWLTGDQPHTIDRDLPTIVDCLLRLSEELYVTSLIKQETPISVKIEEIPEKNRDKSAPVRFRAIGF